VALARHINEGTTAVTNQAASASGVRGVEGYVPTPGRREFDRAHLNDVLRAGDCHWRNRFRLIKLQRKVGALKK